MTTTRNNQRRKKKIEWLETAISNFFEAKPQGAISRERLISEFVLVFNSTERTGKEILKALAQAEKIKIDGDLITQ